MNPIPTGTRSSRPSASIGIVILLLLTAVQIGESVYGRLTSPNGAQPDASTLAFAMMGVTIVVNILVSFYEHRQGKKLKSVFLIADSRHTLSDVFVSISVVASLVAVKTGHPEVDAIVGGIIALVIAYAAVRIMKEASVVLLDRAVLDPARVEEICMSLNIDGMQGCHKIRSRGSESAYWIDLHLIVDPDLSTKESHSIASKVERSIKDEFGEETDTVIHIEPGRETGRETARETGRDTGPSV